MKLIYRRQNGKWSSDRGSILAVSAISMLAVLLAVGLAVDISHMYVVASELQNAADAASLAGASALNSEVSGIDEAVTRAKAAMNKYEFDKTPITIQDDQVRFAIDLSEFDGGGTGRDIASAKQSGVVEQIRFVQVTAAPPSTVNVIFSAIALGATVDMSRRAVAGQSRAINTFCNIAPLSVAEGSAGNPLHPIGTCSDPNAQLYFAKGCTYVIRLDAGGGNGGGSDGGNGGGGGGCSDSNGNDWGSVSPGNFLILDLQSERVQQGGGAQVRQLLALGVDGCYNCDSELDKMQTQTGLLAGPVRDGLNTRFGIGYGTGGLNAEDHPPDANVAFPINYDQYLTGEDAVAPESGNGVPGRRVVIIPIISEAEYGNGKSTVQTCKYGAFFLREPVAECGNGGAIIAEYIGTQAVVADGGYLPGTTTPSNAQLTVPVIYR